MKRYICDICGSEVDKQDIAQVLAIDEDNEQIEEWGDWCQKCRDRFSRIAREWRGSE